jgi:NAD(P)H-hydrate epimerase
MRAMDAAAVARLGETPLMRAAGAAIARLVEHHLEAPARIVAFAGAGNNGDDAFAALAELSADYDRVVYAEPAPKASDARRDAEARARAAGVKIAPLPSPFEAERIASEADIVLDGILGANARLPLPESVAALCAAITKSATAVVALDVATGTDPTTGCIDPHAFEAVATIALGAAKLGSLLGDGRARAGEVWVAPIGMTDADGDAASFRALDDDEALALLPSRGVRSDKRLSGAPLVIAGSAQFTGAAVLCARGAARAGAGYVTVATPLGAEATLRAHLVEEVVLTFDPHDVPGAIETLLDAAKRCGSIAIGPGMGLGDEIGAIVRGVVLGTDLPVVADASALFHFAKFLPQLRGRQIVVTPHAGEFARLSGKGTVAEDDRVERLRAFVAEYGITTLLKGEITLVCADDAVVHVNVTGTPALATAGTGDTLTGMIATLLSQRLAPVDAARLGAYWHGRAGQLAAESRPVGVIASDVADALGAATRLGADTVEGATRLV